MLYGAIRLCALGLALCALLPCLPMCETLKDGRAPVETDDGLIRTVCVTGATLAYSAGETPQATASAGACRVVSEVWVCLNGEGHPAAFWTSNGHYPDGTVIFSRFEEGRTYRYGITLVPPDGLDFATPEDGLCVTLNGQRVQSDDIVRLTDEPVISLNGPVLTIPKGE